MTALDFTYEPLPTRVVFAPGGLARLEAEAARLDLQRVLVISTPEQGRDAERAAAALAMRLAGIFTRAAMHTPVKVTDQAMELLREKQVDGLAAIGGGSAIGLSKALALRTDLPQIVIPTTYAGSEATPILGETEDGLKTTQRSSRVSPEVILYDAELTLSLPVGLSVNSGLNAVAHAAEALYAQEFNPLINTMAQEAVRAMVASLPRIHANPDDLEARGEALYGAWLCGTCLAASEMGLHHKICHTLGGAFGLPHAETHAVMLPHVLAYNLPFAPEARRRLARALNCQDPALELNRLARGLGAPRALRDLGMAQGDLDQAADLAVRNAYANPRSIERSGVLAMLTRAWSGDLPSEV
ncbi:MAG: maleylacetate reductase [Rhodopila sp.]|jgi:alcohol dehydrogenase class IV